MIIPFIPKDEKHDDYSCRDGEIDWIIDRYPADTSGGDSDAATSSATEITHTLTPEQTYPTANIRIPLQAGEKEKATLLLNGDDARIDPATAERLTAAIVQKAAEILLDISTDLRRRGLFILPFRVYSMVRATDGSLSYPSAQAVALPASYPPHPEITAASVSDDSLTLALRFPVRPHRLSVDVTPSFPEAGLLTFISYPLYIPDPKVMRGSIGSVRSAAGGTATGIRFTALSESAVKASVAAPEKYYRLAGNVRTGFRLSSSAAKTPDYSCLADLHGCVAPFSRRAMLALGDQADADTDPMDWIADWRQADCSDVGAGYLPESLPHIYWHEDTSVPGASSGTEAIDTDEIRAEANAFGCSHALLTRPMAFADSATSRRHARPKAIRTIRMIGISPDRPAHAVIYASDDGVRWTPLRRFDPRARAHLLTTPRLLWRLLIMTADWPKALAAEIDLFPS